MVKRIIIFLFVVLTALTIWYHIPSNIIKTINIWTLDGKSITVKFDVSWHKYFLKPTELQGTISVDGHIYRTRSYDSSSFFTKVKMKINNKKYIPPFIREMDNLNYIANDLALLYVCDINLDKICLNIKDKDNNYVNYYGKANSIGEAKLLSRKFFDEIINY